MPASVGRRTHVMMNGYGLIEMPSVRELGLGTYTRDVSGSSAKSKRKISVPSMGVWRNEARTTSLLSSFSN